MKDNSELKIGNVVQLSSNVLNKRFQNCLMVVTEVNEWGAIGVIPTIYDGLVFYRAKWDEMDNFIWVKKDVP
jgi:hypothetical protein